jgi:nucleoside-diphosphate-sugar epimerase
MKILVTGNLGYVGTITTEYLKHQGYDVVGLDSGFYRECLLVPIENEVITKTKDIRDVEVSDFTGIEAVVHLAALSNDPIGELDQNLTLEINYLGAVRTAEMAKKAGVEKFIFISTQSIYGISTSTDELDEDNSIKNPQTAYASSKWKAEQEILAMSDSSFTSTALRPSTVFGWSPRLRTDIVFNNLLLTGLKQQRIDVHSDGTPWRPIVHVLDLARAIEVCIKSDNKRISARSFNVGVLNGNFTVKQLAEAAQECLDGIPIAFKTENIVDPRSYKVSFERAQRELGFTAKVGLNTGGAEIVLESKKLIGQGIDLMDRKTNRLLQIKYLLENGLIDGSLRFRQ